MKFEVICDVPLTIWRNVHFVLNVGHISSVKIDHNKKISLNPDVIELTTMSKNKNQQLKRAFQPYNQRNLFST